MIIFSKRLLKLKQESSEIKTGIAEKSRWDQANRRQKLGLVWRNRKKISQIIKDYFYLPFFLLIILCFKDTKTKRRLYWCLIEFIDWRYSQSCWYFWPSLWTIALLTFSLVHSPPLPWVKAQYMQTVCSWEEVGGGGVVDSLSCVRDHILQEFYTMYLTRFRTYKIALPPQTKT